MGVFDEYIAPAIGVILANIMFFSPLPAVLKVRSSQQLGELNSLPYPVITANCIGWCIYASLTRDIFLILGNIPGTLLGIFFTLNSIVFASQKIRDLITAATLIFPLVFISELFVLSMLEAGWDTFVFVLGLTNIIILIIYYAAPLSVFKHVIQTQDSKSLYLPLVVANAVNGCMWFIYGLIALQDPFIWIGNGIGVILNIFAIFLIIVYPRKDQEHNLFRKLISSRSLKARDEWQLKQQREEEFQQMEKTDSNLSDLIAAQTCRDTNDIKTVIVEEPQKVISEKEQCFVIDKV